MTSHRHIALDPLLSAARDCVMDVGFRRTTLADVARRAGVSRMTVYRQYGDLASIVLFGGLGLWAAVSIPLINAREPAWTPPPPGPLSGRRCF